MFMFIFGLLNISRWKIIYVKGALRKYGNMLNQKKNGLKMNVNSYKWMMLSLIDILFVQV